MKENNPIKTGIKKVKKLVNSYVRLIELRSTKKIAEVTSRVTYGLLTLLLIIMGFSFFSFALALYIGKLLSSLALGFLIVGSLPILIILLISIFKRQALRALLNFFTKIMTK